MTGIYLHLFGHLFIVLFRLFAWVLARIVFAYEVREIQVAWCSYENESHKVLQSDKKSWDAIVQMIQILWNTIHRDESLLFRKSGETNKSSDRANSHPKTSTSNWTSCICEASTLDRSSSNKSLSRNIDNIERISANRSAHVLYFFFSFTLSRFFFTFLVSSSPLQARMSWSNLDMGEALPRPIQVPIFLVVVAS